MICTTIIDKRDTSSSDSYSANYDSSDEAQIASKNTARRYDHAMPNVFECKKRKLLINQQASKPGLLTAPPVQTSCLLLRVELQV